MTNRFLAGFHPGFGTWGVWLSKPGIDVTVNSAPANFILRPDVKTHQIVLSGAVSLAPGVVDQEVLFPANLARFPRIYLHGNISGAKEWPCDLNAAGNQHPSRTVYFSVAVFGDRMWFSNGSSYTIVGFYIVFNQSVQ